MEQFAWQIRVVQCFSSLQKNFFLLNKNTKQIFVGGFVHKHSCNDNKNIIAVIINFFVSGIEILGGYLSGSLLLISDALHSLSDSVSIVISYIAIFISPQKNKSKIHVWL